MRRLISDRSLDRLLAFVGIPWILVIGTLVLQAEDVPILWKIPFALYGAVGLLASVATPTGKADLWGRGIRRAQVTVFGFGMVALLVILIREW